MAPKHDRETEPVYSITDGEGWTHFVGEEWDSIPHLVIDRLEASEARDALVETEPGEKVRVGTVTFRDEELVEFNPE